MYGFEIPNPPEILNHGEYRDSPNPSKPLEVYRHEEAIKTTAAWNHHSGAFNSNHYVGSVDFIKTTLLTLHFQWKSLYEMSTEGISDETTHEISKGIVDTKDEIHSFTKSIGAEAGAEGDGISAKLSASLSQTDSSEHSVSFSESETIKRTFRCPINTTTQSWQLIATFTYTETGNLTDPGHSIDSFSPPYNPGTKTLTVHTDRIVSRSYTKP